MIKDLIEKKFSILTLGCKVNTYESDAMRAQLEKAGCVYTENAKDADIYIINTCSVTNMADKKSRQMIHRASKMAPKAVIVASGCFVQSAGEEICLQNGVDVILGNNRKKNIVDVISEYYVSKEKISDIPDMTHENEYEEMELGSGYEHTRAFLKIQDGCNQFCSYCIIPYTRGRIRSRSMENVLHEVSGLAKRGYKEVVLTGIHISSYGLKETNEKYPLITLIEKIEEIDGIERIRIGSLEPRIITEEFTERLSKCKKLCPQFHLSLQSGCDSVLKRMNRKYTTSEYAESVDILRRYFDNPSITTDIIVGFPQETDEEFNCTIEFAKKIGFAKIHVFKYSRRHGTVADKMSGQIDESVKNTRSDILLDIEGALGREYRSGFEGKEDKVLFEEEEMIDGIRYMVGYNERYVRYAVKTDEDLQNRILDIKAGNAEIKDGVLLAFLPNAAFTF